MPPLQEPKYKILRRLPQEIQNAITSPDSPMTNQAIGMRYGLSPEKISLLAEEIGLVLLGLTQPKTFTERIQKQLLVPKNQAEQLAKAVNEKTFSPIQQSLKNLHAITVWNIGMGPEPEALIAPPSLWLSMKNRRGVAPASIFDAMKKHRQEMNLKSTGV